MIIYNLEKNKEIKLEQYNQKSLTFLYKTKFGRLCLKLVINPMISKIYGKYNNSKLSCRKINKFIKKNKIDMSEYVKTNYKSFNDFFTRKIKQSKRSFSNKKEDFCSCCDSKVLAYKIDENLTFKIKNSIYSVEELIKNEKLAKEYKNGICLVLRLTVDDYHRYSFFDNGKLIENKKINGVLHTVSPISFEKYKVFLENSREINVLSTENFGKVIQVEVGALMVGKIVNHDIDSFERGDEKGYFEFGGSTIVQLFKENELELNEKIWEYSNKGIETKVKQGMKIGIKK